MEENGGNGGEWGNSGRSTRNMGCGGLWLRKMGQKWEKHGTKYPLFTVPCFPFFPKIEDLSHSSLCKNQVTALTDGKMAIFATHRHSPPRRLVRMLETAPHSPPEAVVICGIYWTSDGHQLLLVAPHFGGVSVVIQPVPCILVPPAFVD